MTNRFLIKVVLVITALLGVAVVDAIEISKVLVTPGLKQAWVYLEMKDYKRAEGALRECYLDTTETGATCNFIRARILDRQKNVLGAIDAYKRSFARSTNPGIREEALFRKSELFFERKYFYESSSGFRAYVKQYPEARNIEKAYLYLAKSLDLTKNQSEALEAYEKAGSGSAALYGKANVLQRLGRTNEAQQMYDKAVVEDSAYLDKSVDTRYLYGENLIQTGNVQKAKEVLRPIVDNVTFSDVKLKQKVNLALGTIEADGSNNEAAVKYLAAAVREKNMGTDIKPKALMRLARVQIASNKLIDARRSIDDLKKLFVSSKDKGERDLLTLELLLKEKNITEAVKILRTMFAAQPNSKELLLKLEAVLNATALSDKEQFTALWEDYGKMFMDKAHEKLVLQAADILKDSGGKPYIDVLEWISLNSSDEQQQNALYELSNLYSNIGDKAAAVKYLSELKRFKVPADDILRSEAKVLFENNDLQGVYERLTAMKHLKREDLPMLRDAVGAARNKEKALAFYDHVLRSLGAETGDAMTLAENFYQMGRKDDAIYYYKQVLTKDPTNEWALYRIGIMQNGTEGKEALKKLSEGNSQLSKFAKSIIQGDGVNKQLEDLQ
ncbi:MAG: tetratricopeptide repeat protein [Nitrospirae bacterium]|nr:tetratricopeptide repeat protein [Nitrospirota bacterium]